MKETRAPWVVAGGRQGEIGHCTRCGDGLNLGGPQLLGVAGAAMKAFVKAHSNCQDTGKVEEPPTNPVDWAQGRDTGISSGTIYSVLTGRGSPCRGHDIPHDPSDFGRCYRLLALFPEWRPQLYLVAKAYPAWKPFVREWDKLTAMYEDALNDTPAGAWMYRWMQELEKEGQGG
jgi:hypothetical protein